MKTDNLTPGQADKMENITGNKAALDMEKLEKVSGGGTIGPAIKNDPGETVVRNTGEASVCPACGGNRYWINPAFNARHCLDCDYTPL